VIALMTVHVPHAGDGYTYLTRQVASGDHQRRRGEALADTARPSAAPIWRLVDATVAATPAWLRGIPDSAVFVIGALTSPNPKPKTK
jgi:hypothetical protein